VRPWEQYTGKQATLDGNGRTFDEIAAERYPLGREGKSRWVSRTASRATRIMVMQGNPGKRPTNDREPQPELFLGLGTSKMQVRCVRSSTTSPT
jgi:hypothetical protein